MGMQKCGKKSHKKHANYNIKYIISKINKLVSYEKSKVIIPDNMNYK